jgi:hypothetical protein
MPRRARTAAASSARAAAALSIDGLTAFANWPLRIVGALGTLLALAAFAMAATCVVYMLYGHPVSAGPRSWCC